jgi:Flp pilus assembly protein TadG
MVTVESCSPVADATLRRVDDQQMIFAALIRQLGRLRRARRGNVTMIAALCAPFLIAGVGFAIDFANASYVNQRIAEAADTAVLAAVSQSAANAGGGYSNTAWLQAFGNNLFNANIAKMGISVNETLTVTANSQGGATASLTYNYKVPTFFGGLFGLSSMPVSGSIGATANPIVYINYYFIVDASQSMGIGATQTDMSNLYARVAAASPAVVTAPDTGCVFACHVPLTGTVAVETLAHESPRITLRIDSAISAIQSVISAAQNSAGTNQNIKIAIYTMNKDPTVSNPPYINVISPLSANYTTLSANANNIDLGGNTSSGIGDTDTADQLNKFATTVLPASNGKGTSASDAINYVFIITDGVTDTYSSGCADTHCVSAYTASQCSALKKAATVGVIYTTYLPIYNNNNSSQGLDGRYTTLISPIASQIAPALQTCASSLTYYYEASDGPAITTGMNALFASSEQAARLTQ